MTHIVRATSKRYLPFHTRSLHLPRKDSAGVRTDLNLAKQYGSGGVEGVACGTGAVLLYLTRHGIDADGTNISPAKRFVTRVKAEAMELHLNICPADMTMFSSLRQYSLANIADPASCIFPRRKNRNRRCGIRQTSCIPAASCP